MINKVHNMDCIEGLRLLEDNSIDSIVTDPPYELGFMGKAWDSTGIAYNVELWKQCLRVLKPGGHLLSFGGTRTYHRMACAIEDAGFEIRDQIQWIYGSGFPKSHNISKALDGTLGKQGKGFVSAGDDGRKAEFKQDLSYRSDYGYIYEPATPEAKQWQGFGTALKPANEPIVLARKPLSERTIASNVLRWGCGGLNIDGCRVSLNGEKIPTGSGKPCPKGNADMMSRALGNGGNTTNALGRFPANVIFDEDAGKALDEQSGIRPSGKGNGNAKVGEGSNGAIPMMNRGTLVSRNDVGGASRFFKNIEWSEYDWKYIYAITAEQNSATIQETEPKDTSFVQSHAVQNLDSLSQNLSALSAETKLRSIAINIVQRLAQILQDGTMESMESEQIQRIIAKEFPTEKSDSIGIQLLNLVQYVEAKENIDTTQIIASLEKLYGCVYPAIVKSTEVMFKYNAKASKADRGIGNIHPTVKPQKLMEYLVTIVTPPQGIVLDPFAGSGSTLVAAEGLGFQWIGFEMNKEYCDICDTRLSKDVPLENKVPQC